MSIPFDVTEQCIQNAVEPDYTNVKDLIYKTYQYSADLLATNNVSPYANLYTDIQYSSFLGVTDPNLMLSIGDGSGQVINNDSMIQNEIVGYLLQQIKLLELRVTALENK